MQLAKAKAQELKVVTLNMNSFLVVICSGKSLTYPIHGGGMHFMCPRKQLVLKKVRHPSLEKKKKKLNASLEWTHLHTIPALCERKSTRLCVVITHVHHLYG